MKTNVSNHEISFNLISSAPTALLQAWLQYVAMLKMDTQLYTAQYAKCNYIFGFSMHAEM